MKILRAFKSRIVLSIPAFALLLLAPQVKGDGIVLSVEDVSATAGSSGTFDVLLTNDGTTTQNIAVVAFGLTTTDTNISFNDVTTGTTTAPYIFPVSAFGPDIVLAASNQSVSALDEDGSAAFTGTDVAPGATYALGSVSYTIAGGASSGEIADIDFVDYPTTSLSDAAANNVDFTAESGTITVQTLSTVPEPSTALPLCAAVLALAALIRGRRIA